MVESEDSRLISKAARNERRKAFAATCNALSVALFISAGLQPLMAGRFNLLGALVISAVVVALQIVLHYILRQVED
ncbi:hypothetical protein CSW62_04220 [Caulobacter sp. FWC2]|nr:hypothetical protein CSW62_04220 [Caulobacter sp. FWC2]